MRCFFVLAVAILLCGLFFDGRSRSETQWQFRSKAYPCAPHLEMHENLQKAPHAERIIWWGITTEGALVAGYVDDLGGWTIVRTGPEGMSCIVGHGNSWVLEQETDNGKKDTF